MIIDFHEIQQVRQRKVSPSKLDKIAVGLRETANLVKLEWSNFSPESRERLKELAYKLIERPSGLPNLWIGIRVKAYMLFIKATNQTAAFCSCIEALDMLVDNILDAIEREDPSYQAVLSDTLEQLYSKKVQGEELKPEETREWLRNLSAQALREV
nr:hypothetical protein [Iningainema tapete]